MTADAFRHEHSFSSLTAGFIVFKQTLGHITKMFGYAVVLAVYVSIFIVSIATLALIEIRQANLKDFDALIATLEQQERYFTNGRFEQVLTGLAKDIDQYRQLDASLPCSDKASGPLTGQTGAIGTIAQMPNGGSIEETTQPKSCAEVKTIADQHLYGLLSLQDNLSFEKAKLPKYYDEYTDGLRDKAPQLIPLLRYVDSKNEVVTAWARLPLELLEMLLLVGMGALGGVIAVTRSFVDTSTPNPLARDLCYRPVAGAVIGRSEFMFCSEPRNCFSAAAVRMAPQQCPQASFCWPHWDWDRAFALARRLLRSKLRQREYCIVQKAAATATIIELARVAKSFCSTATSTTSAAATGAGASMSAERICESRGSGDLSYGGIPSSDEGRREC
jgi:hypothetical protein